MRLWRRPQRFVAMVKERSRAWSSALLVATLTLGLASFGAITPPTPAEANNGACPANTTFITYTYSSPNCTATFSFSGSHHTWRVPAGVTTATFTLRGAQGGSSSNGYVAGTGAVVSGTLTNLSAGTNLFLYVGGQGNSSGVGGFNGGGIGRPYGGGQSGGGGGGTDIRKVIDDVNSRVAVAGGGGGASSYASNCSGTAGAPNAPDSSAYNCSWTWWGGKQWPPTNPRGDNYDIYYTPPTLGAGGFQNGNSLCGGFCPSPGGGGGYYGGTSGVVGAGGGSSWFDASSANSPYVTGGTYSAANNTGNGQIQITYLAGATITNYIATNAVNLVNGDNGFISGRSINY